MATNTPKLNYNIASEASKCNYGKCLLFFFRFPEAILSYWGECRNVKNS